MIETRDESLEQVGALLLRICALEHIIEQRDASLDRCEAALQKMRERVGAGFRGEVRALSDSIKDLIQ